MFNIHQILSFSRQCLLLWASLVAQLVKNLLAKREAWVRSLGWEDPLEKGRVIHSYILWASLVAQLVKNPPATK